MNFEAIRGKGMGGYRDDYYDPFQVMKDYYRLQDPTEEEQFRFVEAMQELIRRESEPYVYMYNLADYYLGIRNFELEKKYAEMAVKAGDNTACSLLGYLWYYGQTGKVDYQRAFEYFERAKAFPRCQYKLADMYRDGLYVERNPEKYEEIIVRLYYRERKNKCFVYSTCYPEVALRFVQLCLEEEIDSVDELESLFYARDILAVRQQNRPFWGNIKTMRRILETTAFMTGNDFDFVDLYDLLTFDKQEATITFDYQGTMYRLDIFQNGGQTVYEFQDRWYHGASDFLEKAHVDGKRITSVYDLISDIQLFTYKGRHVRDF